MQDLIGLDFETYGAVDLRKHGLDRYVNDPSFTTTLASTYWAIGNVPRKGRFDFAQDFKGARDYLLDTIGDNYIAAHNAPFEAACLKWLGHPLPHDRFVDSAVVARVAGAGSRLEAAAPQLLDVNKMEEGRDLIKLFAIPGKYQEANGSDMFDPDITRAYAVEWGTFGDYCDLDAELSYWLVQKYGHWLGDNERKYTAITSDMNDVGWHVDMAAVHEMQARYFDNQSRALATFRATHEELVDMDDYLNFNSHKQLKEWCEKRGVKARSFDEANVEKLLVKITERLARGGLTLTREQEIREVEEMLKTKQILGGSSLKKLQTIIDMVGPGDQLRNSYLHVGAGQSLRTSGRGVQMQNLKRLTSPADMSLLDDPGEDWTNDELAVNLRQVFTASHPQGQLVVGDLASIESRGLALLAEEEWKVEAYANKKDLYKVQATKIYQGLAYDAVTKEQRTTGKVGELSCGYGAGPDAVQSFAEGMGVALTKGECTDLVYNWRDANPMVVQLWEILDSLLKEIVVDKQSVMSRHIGYGMRVEFQVIDTPRSLLKQAPGVQSVQMKLYNPVGNLLLRRIFHGCYIRGRNVCYFKPASNKTGDLWVNHYRHPKSKEIVFFNLYGGKLAGILTQSLCREIFFEILDRVHNRLLAVDNVHVIGQFHDEIVLDWTPLQTGRSLKLAQVIPWLEREMSRSPLLPMLPMAAEVKHDHRYTK